MPFYRRVVSTFERDPALSSCCGEQEAVPALSGHCHLQALHHTGGLKTWRKVPINLLSLDLLFSSFLGNF